MQFCSIFVSTFVVLTVVQAASTKKSCKVPSDCPAGYTCVSLEASIDGLTDLSQCAEKPACSGVDVGYCPSGFESRGSKYKKLDPICAFTIVDKDKVCGNIVDPTDTTPAPATTAPATTAPATTAPSTNDPKTTEPSTEQPKTTEPATDEPTTTAPATESRQLADKTNAPNKVDCYDIDDGKGKKVYGFYKCLDVAKYKKEDLQGLSEYRPKQLAACAGDDKTSKLCNGHGTCAPIAQKSLEYKCKCFIGYGGKNCNKIVSNKCNHAGQCGVGGDCKNGECSCKNGFKADQCSKCDSKAKSTCSENGACDPVSGKCKCNAGYKGDFCKAVDPNIAGLISPSTILMTIFGCIAAFLF